ncbi:MAG TPA: hypothetical protein IGS17_17770 [Oscillatoriales cyanobacterium M59_W2019_021]|nr:hypothetical protein [Oscillatoriales cyanobacterium M4454_W2019_049]HIK52751.1 hypothetical protein [Oscillatoriales cyanobacterium M59_W2019_021]
MTLHKHFVPVLLNCNRNDRLFYSDRPSPNRARAGKISRSNSQNLERSG